MYQIDIPTEHPELAALLAAIKEAHEAHAAAFHPGDDYFNSRERQHCDPTSWTTSIEAALDKPAELANLKMQRREALISGEAAILFAEVKVRRAISTERKLASAIEDAVKACERIDKNTPDRWLKDVLQNNIVFARNELCCRCSFLTSKPEPLSDSITQETQPAAQAAFAALAAAGIPERNVSRDFVGHSFANLYPLTPACSASALNISRSMYDEARHVRLVPLVDELEPKLPAIKRLIELFDKLDVARLKAYEASKILKDREKGSVNERQYAARLARSLENPGANLKDESDAQHARRLYYQSARLALHASVISAEGIRMEVVKALKAAVAETAHLDAEIRKADAQSNIDKRLACRIAIVNCLAADCFVRVTGNQLEEWHEQWVEDITGGKGAEALSKELSHISRQHRQPAHKA